MKMVCGLRGGWWVVVVLISLIGSIHSVGAKGKLDRTNGEEPPKPEGRYSYHEGCSYGVYDWYEHEEVVDSMPECCLQLKCEDGNITRQYFNQPGDHGCCEFNGTMYAEGTELPGFCWKLLCQNSSWINTGCLDDCCGHCFVHTDPHIKTFDGHKYDFHGTCNYTLAQTKDFNMFSTYYPGYPQGRSYQIEDWTYQPEVAVYSDFEPCFGGASCLDESTFQDNPNTVITMHADSVFTLGVNGNSFVVPATGVHQVAFPDCDVYHPVLAFQYNGCVVLLGSSRIAVMSCPYRLDIWAHPSLTDGLNGLCGLYSDYQADDFTDRFSHVHTLQQRPTSTYPSTWMTNEQIDDQCTFPCKEEGKGCNGNLQTLPDDACIPTDPSFQSSKNLCRTELGITVDPYLLDSCAHDICVMRRNGNMMEAQQGWLHTLKLNAAAATLLEEAEACLPPTTTPPAGEPSTTTDGTTTTTIGNTTPGASTDGSSTTISQATTSQWTTWEWTPTELPTTVTTSTESTTIPTTTTTISTTTV